MSLEIEHRSWAIEIERFKAIKTTFILEGNIFDLHPFPTIREDQVHYPMHQIDYYLHHFLLQQGYDYVVFYNHIDGFYNDCRPDHLDQFSRMSRGKEVRHAEEEETLEGREINERGKRLEATLDRATVMVRSAIESRQGAIAVIFNLASRYVGAPNHLEENEQQFYSRLLLSSLKPIQQRSMKTGDIINNMMVFLCDKANDVPAWFYLENPYVKVLNVTRPDRRTRQRFIDSQFLTFIGEEEASLDEKKEFIQTFVDLTDGFTSIELNGLRTLCRNEEIPISKIADAITLYKHGIKENLWQEIDSDRLKGAEQFIRRRVKGQDQAVTQTLDIIKRAVSGMAGIQHSNQGSKPKGILFFAGPTGTGKTELAKTISELLFGDESSCVRFDMSEYQQSHSDEKLLGAPPGYVGYDAGGQLTNAIKENPFSILLFDEIEKAHPSVMDKFLQILEDGRMTDGKGETVYFSESVIIFTSNLGTYVEDEYGRRQANINSTMEYEEINERVLKAISDYFTLNLGRPEILNRIGNNFVVFDYIREEVAHLILDSQLNKIINNLQKQREINISIEEAAYLAIQKKAFANLNNGGRGIGNVVESYFVNPLSRYLFDHNVKKGKIIIHKISEEDSVVHIECTNEL